jgi:hypothetical protein
VSLGFSRYTGEAERYLVAEKRDALRAWGAFVAAMLLAFHDNAVDWQFLTRPHSKPIAHMHLIQRNVLLRAARQNAARLTDALCGGLPPAADGRDSVRADLG